jgi:hypothetical protein
MKSRIKAKAAIIIAVTLACIHGIVGFSKSKDEFIANSHNNMHLGLDPKIFTKPRDSARKWFMHPEWEIMEYAGEENNKTFQEGYIAPGPTGPAARILTSTLNRYVAPAKA